MRKLILIIFICFAVNINAQTYDSIFTNNKYMVTEFSDNIPETILLDNDDDTIWISYLEDLNYANCRIIALDNDLNIIHNTLINYTPSVANMVNYKINDKFYSIYYTDAFNRDTLQFRCFDRNGNIVVNKSLWERNNEDTLWLRNIFTIRRLSDNTIFLISNADYPSNTSNTGTSAVKLFIIDTMANILKTKTYPLKTNNNLMSVCEIDNNIIVSKWFYGNPPPSGVFSTLGMTILNKENLEVVDSILPIPYCDTLPDGYILDWCVGYHRIGQINDSIFAGKLICNGKPEIHIINKNTKETIHFFRYFVEGADTNDDISAEDDGDHSNRFGAFAFTNPDSIYTYYFVNSCLEILNFGIFGNINFTYRFTFNNLRYPQLRGLKATKDGGLILSAFGTSANTLKRASWLIKFKPTGLINLTNIETGEKETIKVYPNPAKDYIYVDIEATNFDKGEIELFDMQGKLLKRAKLNAKQGNRVDISNLNAGAYSYNVSLNGKTISGKIIIGE